MDQAPVKIALNTKRDCGDGTESSPRELMEEFIRNLDDFKARMQEELDKEHVTCMIHTLELHLTESALARELMLITLHDAKHKAEEN